MKEFMLRVRLSHEQRHALIEKCQKSGKTMSKLTIESLCLPVLPRQARAQNDVKSESNTETAETASNHVSNVICNEIERSLKKTYSAPWEGCTNQAECKHEVALKEVRTCIEPGCAIFVDKPVLIHGNQAWICPLHAP